MRGISKKMVKKARKAKVELIEKIKVNPDVKGVGIGYIRRKGKLVNRCCIRVHVRKKFPSHLVPKERLLPEKINGFPVDVIEGIYETHQDEDPTEYFNPIIAGIQVGNNDNNNNVGTLGCFLYDDLEDETYILSNWHVFHGGPDASNEIVQPRPDGGENIIAHIVEKDKFITDTVDCAVAQLNRSRDWENSVVNLPIQITGWKEAKHGMELIKSGKNGIAYGRIEEILERVEILMNGEIKYFEDQLHIFPYEGKPFYVDKGDSGSVWISEDDGKVVGLHIGGLSYTTAIANQMTNVMAAIKAERPNIDFNY